MVQGSINLEELEMNIYQLFQQDQLQIIKLIEQLRDIKEVTLVKQLLKEIYNTAFIYTKSEEQVLYKALKQRLGKLAILVEAGDHEHKLLLSSIEILQELDPLQTEWKSLIKFVKSLLEQHSDKVDSQVFELAKTYLTEAEIAKMGTEVYEIRKNLPGVLRS